MPDTFIKNQERENSVMGESKFNIEFNGRNLAKTAAVFMPVTPIIMSDTDDNTDKESATNGKFNICHASFVCGWQKCGTILFNN